MAGAQETPTCFLVPATIVGTPGPDELTGTEGPDVIVGLGGNDDISGLGGDDLICGEADGLIKKGGDDQISGGDGSDVISGDAGIGEVRKGGDDQIFGDAGFDTLEGMTTSSPCTSPAMSSLPPPPEGDQGRGRHVVPLPSPEMKSPSEATTRSPAARMATTIFPVATGANHGSRWTRDRHEGRERPDLRGRRGRRHGW
jgi:hypothetical protein